MPVPTLTSERIAQRDAESNPFGQASGRMASYRRVIGRTTNQDLASERLDVVREGLDLRQQIADRAASVAEKAVTTKALETDRALQAADTYFSEAATIDPYSPDGKAKFADLKRRTIAAADHPDVKAHSDYLLKGFEKADAYGMLWAPHPKPEVPAGMEPTGATVEGIHYGFPKTEPTPPAGMVATGATVGGVHYESPKAPPDHALKEFNSKLETNFGITAESLDSPNQKLVRPATSADITGSQPALKAGTSTPAVVGDMIGATPDQATHVFVPVFKNGKAESPLPIPIDRWNEIKTQRDDLVTPPIASQEEFDKLPSGSRFKFNGKTGVKK